MRGDGGWVVAVVLAVAGCTPVPHAAPEGCVVARPRQLERADNPRSALTAFLDGAARGDFEACWHLLASPLRERYTPARLAEDFGAVRASAEEKLARARASLRADPRIRNGHAEFPLSERKAVRLVLETGGWRIASLE